MAGCQSVILAGYNPTTDTYTCVMVRDIVQEMLTNTQPQYTVYLGIAHKTTFGKKFVFKIQDLKSRN